MTAALSRVGGDAPPPPKPRRVWKLLPLGFAACAAALIVVVAINASRGPVPAPPALAPPRPGLPSPPPPAAWLGLDYNSGADAGRLNDFTVRTIVYDREGGLEVKAGETPGNSPRFANGLAASYGAEMVPDIVVNPASGPTGCEGNPNPRKLCLPTSETDIGSYVRGFIQTASSVLQTQPGKRMLFEPLNEPWDWASPPGTQPGRGAAAQYAAVLSQLLPAAAASNSTDRHLRPGKGNAGRWNLVGLGPVHGTTVSDAGARLVRTDRRLERTSVRASELLHRRDRLGAWGTRRHAFRAEQPDRVRDRVLRNRRKRRKELQPEQGGHRLPFATGSAIQAFAFPLPLLRIGALRCATRSYPCRRARASGARHHQRR